MNITLSIYELFAIMASILVTGFILGVWAGLIEIEIPEDYDRIKQRKNN